MHIRGCQAETNKQTKKNCENANFSFSPIQIIFKRTENVAKDEKRGKR